MGKWMHLSGCYATAHWSGAHSDADSGWPREEKSMQAYMDAAQQGLLRPAKYPLLDRAPPPTTIPEAFCEVC